MSTKTQDDNPVPPRYRADALIAYKGGGYSGCIWEWNYALFDSDGTFYSLRDSGRKGCSSEDELREYIDECNRGVSAESVYFYDLYDEDSVREFSEHHNAGHVVNLVRELNDTYEYKITFECDLCERDIRDGRLAGRTGAGGTRTKMTIKVCDDCYASHECRNCHTFYRDNSEFRAARCQYCFRFSEFRGESRNMLIELANIDVTIEELENKLERSHLLFEDQVRDVLDDLRNERDGLESQLHHLLRKE
jgi:hypothetical protein